MNEGRELKFQTLIETRFADPVTALDLSLKYVCFGIAMGRISFYSIPDQEERVMFDSQPELIRGISHDAKGNKIWASVGDLAFLSFDGDTLVTEEPTYIVEDVNEKEHKVNCEQTVTLNKNHMGCIVTVNMSQIKG